jgi:hypothetical protein
VLINCKKEWFFGIMIGKMEIKGEQLSETAAENQNPERIMFKRIKLSTKNFKNILKTKQ